MDAVLMRMTSSPALLLASLLAFGTGCAASTDAPPSTEKPAEQPGSGAPSTGGEASEPPAAEAPATCADAPAGIVADVSVSDLKALMDKGSKLVVVDVREPDETAQGTIEGALLYPWTSKVLQARHGELPTDRPIYVICRSGSRSSAASAFLAKNGHACIHDVRGGMNAWAAASYPTTK